MSAAEICLRILALGTAGFTIVFSLLSVLAAKRFKDLGASFQAVDPETLPPITILKPVKDIERGMYANLASFLSQDYPKFQVLFSLQNPDDPALDILERLRKDFPHVDMEIVVSKNRIGYNPKINNISNAYPFAKHDMIMISDSDIRVKPGFLKRIAAPMADPSLGMVTCFYRSDSGPSLGSIMEALSINAQFLPNVLVAGFLIGLRFGLGAVMLVRRSALEESGGLANLSAHLADDYILGYSVVNAGYRLAFSDAVVESAPSFHSLPEAIAHLMRWSKTIRVCQPAGYLGLVALQSTPFLLLYLLIFGPAHSIITAGLLVLLARIGSIAWIHWHYLESPDVASQLIWVPISDLLQFCVWISGFHSGAVLWRGEYYDIAFSGRLVPRKKTSSAASSAATGTY